MLLKQAARGDEKVYVTVKCVEASSITLGYGVAYRVGTAGSFDGTQAVMADSDVTADLPAFIGVAAQDIASNSYGLVQVFGPVASVYLSNTATSVTINNGDPLVPGKGAGGLGSAAPTYANSGFKYVIASSVPTAISAVAYCSGLIVHI